MLNAILQRELVSMLRRRRMLALQWGLVIVFGLLVALRWPTDARIAKAGTRSHQVFQLFSYGLLVTMLFLLPVFPSTSIVREKKQGTLALLLNTPLGPIRIFLGKLVAVLALAGIILAMSLPAASACYAMGGLSLTKDLFRVYLLLALVALQYSAIALLISSFSQSIDASVRMTYGAVLTLSILTLGPHYFFQGTSGYLADVGEILRSLSPFAVLMSLTGSGDAASQGIMTKVDLMGRFAVALFDNFGNRVNLDDLAFESHDL